VRSTAWRVFGKIKARRDWGLGSCRSHAAQEAEAPQHNAGTQLVAQPCI
jgi:hypothetical protein